ncbi:UPF0182 family membrane protein [Archaeoglobus neptunius]|uniref:UPF0182 family membrane protein n=1 Tax=Archaeoglobus neptunius TaxID=2798580 RepID=UPI00192903BE|nr:UPF0182 family protein [Archaeoglobus neptunius]
MQQLPVPPYPPPYKPPELKVLYFIAGIIAVTALVSLSVYYYTEYLWFESVGYGSVFITYLKYSIGFFILVFAIFMTFLTATIVAVKKVTMEFLGEPLKIPHLLSLAISLFAAFSMQSQWKSMLFYINSAEYGIKDPIFGLDAAFYTFQLPFLKMVIGILLAAAVISITIAIFAYIYAFRWVKSFDEFKEIFPTSGFVHLGINVLILLSLAGALIYISRFEIVHSQHGLLSGAGYVEVNILSPALLLVSALSFVSGISAAYLIAKKNFEMVFYVIVLFVAISILAAVIVPFAVQKLQVEPSELSYESRYLEYSINYTLYAYGLQNVEYRFFKYSPTLNYTDVLKAKATIDNIRVWDHRPIRDVFRQLQQIRTYYFINDVDVDRYWINGNYTQLMLAARELSTDLLPSRAQTWLNKHLIYTHGYGIVASPVNAVSAEGLPEMVLYDIPPRGEIKIKRPEIYYGELTDDYVVVNTLQQEFDYPVGNKNYFTKYSGDGGVKLDYMRRVLYSFRFADINLILSEYITDESRLMMHRDIIERVNTIMPFLTYDSDPYVAVINGQIYWIIDAYSLVDRFPYSAEIGRYNYMQNPVKVFINAYNGSVKFYIVKEDAYVKTLEKALPGVFIKEMPEEFKKHIRYPRDFFKIQAYIYSTYHMKDVTAFYNREDVWDVPTEKFEDDVIKVEPYYVTLAIENKPEFILMVPFTPKNRDNMIAWMAARCDDKYGELIIYEFPKGELIYGPMQIEARIDQDAELSKLFTLWNQAGSRVIRGNLLVIPLNNSILYVEPIYLRGESTKIPELRGVVAVHNDELRMGSTIYDALEMIFGKKSEVVEKPKEKAGTAEEKLGLLKEYYSKLMEAMKNGDWKTFGEMLNRIGEVLGYSKQ